MTFVKSFVALDKGVRRRKCAKTALRVPRNGFLPLSSAVVSRGSARPVANLSRRSGVSSGSSRFHFYNEVCGVVRRPPKARRDGQVATASKLDFEVTVWEGNRLDGERTYKGRDILAGFRSYLEGLPPDLYVRTETLLFDYIGLDEAAGGLNCALVTEFAVKRGMTPPPASLTDKQWDALVEAAHRMRYPHA